MIRITIYYNTALLLMLVDVARWILRFVSGGSVVNPKKKMDETGVEPMTSCLQGRRATNYATRPFGENERSGLSQTET